MKALLDFLFGKEAQIFNKKGEVEHQFPKKKWEDWQKRYFSQAEYNWRNHKGTQAKSQKNSKPHS